MPIIVYNPHPYPVETIVECEFQLQDQNHSGTFTDAVAVDASGRELPTQIEKEASNLPIDWRKRVVFAATFSPARSTASTASSSSSPRSPPRSSRSPPEVPEPGLIRFRNREAWRC